MKHNEHNKQDIDKRHHDHLATGYSDNFVPLEALDLSKVKTVNDLVTRMSKCSFGARNIGEAADVLEAMVRDKDCFKVLTLSGAVCYLYRFYYFHFQMHMQAMKTHLFYAVAIQFLQVS